MIIISIPFNCCDKSLKKISCALGLYSQIDVVNHGGKDIRTGREGRGAGAGSGLISLRLHSGSRKKKRKWGLAPKSDPSDIFYPVGFTSKGSRTLLNSFTSGMGIQCSNTCNTVAHFNSTQQQLYVGEYWAFLSWYHR